MGQTIVSCALPAVVLLHLNFAFFFAACDEFVVLAILSPANWLRLCCSVGQTIVFRRLPVSEESFKVKCGRALSLQDEA